jgi:hypothetical protein
MLIYFKLSYLLSWCTVQYEAFEAAVSDKTLPLLTAWLDLSTGTHEHRGIADFQAIRMLFGFPSLSLCVSLPRTPFFPSSLSFLCSFFISFSPPFFVSCLVISLLVKLVT